jgi:small subunit ribosomal protein S13
MAEENIKYIVRVANTDLDGKKQIGIAITKIKGIGRMFANAICSVIELDVTKKAGALSEAEIKKLNEVIASPLKFDIPVWMVNRRKDYETGEDGHLITADLAFSKQNDIKRMRKSKSYKGMRHSWGVPVRGQRTKSNFRKNKGKVKGVTRKKK